MSIISQLLKETTRSVIFLRDTECWPCNASGCLTSFNLGQLSLPSLRGRLIEYQPLWLGFRRGVCTCVGWQVTLRDPVAVRRLDQGDDQNKNTYTNALRRELS